MTCETIIKYRLVNQGEIIANYNSTADLIMQDVSHNSIYYDLEM